MLNEYLSTFHDVLQRTVFTSAAGTILTEMKALEEIFTIFDTLKKTQRTVFLVGNGGSNGIVSHASVDLMNTCKIKAMPFSDSSQLTCFANDFGYEQVFSTPLETAMTSEDALIAVSSSGSSKNIVKAVQVARAKSAFVLTLTGFNPENAVRSLGTINVWLDSHHYGMVEIGHQLLLHYITDSYNTRLQV